MASNSTKNLQPPTATCPFCGKPAVRGTTPYGATTYDCEACLWGAVDSTARTTRPDLESPEAFDPAVFADWLNERRAAEQAVIDTARVLAGSGAFHPKDLNRGVFGEYFAASAIYVRSLQSALAALDALQPPDLPGEA